MAKYDAIFKYFSYNIKAISNKDGIYMSEIELIRLNKYIADSGICSRRKADELIEKGLVRVNGEVALMGMRVKPTDSVMINNKFIKPVEEKVYLAFNKPVGITCTADLEDETNVIDYVNYPKRITYCGRLDKDSEGLLILTNDGDIINKMMKAVNYHEKEYIVSVDKKVTKGFIKRMSEGVYLEELDTTTRPCKVKAFDDENTFQIVLTQGLNRQIRRMCEALGFHVISLKRIRVMNIKLGNLKSGKCRELTDSEIRNLKSMLIGSKK